MCGFLFLQQENYNITEREFSASFNKIKWRGPDKSNITILNGGKTFLGHHRLEIIQPGHMADQPMVFGNGRFFLLFNGEIYNHLELRKQLDLQCKSNSDTETLAKAYLKLGDALFSKIDGMFSIVIFDQLTCSWTASRDAFGIKPLFIYSGSKGVALGSEASAIASMLGNSIDEDSLVEWEIFRRPIPGYSYYTNISEVIPGSIIKSNGAITSHWKWEPLDEEFSLPQCETLLNDAIKAHSISDFKAVSLLSGGIDSALISQLSDVSTCYSVGLASNNEFHGAKKTAREIKKHLITKELKEHELIDLWKMLTKLRGEPISLPNEGLIYAVCCAMEKDEKVVLSGEGADELFFGYDKIFRWASREKNINLHETIQMYSYSHRQPTERAMHYLHDLSTGKKPIDFIEDMFYQLHLPGLLRRVDFSSMAASKEVRVPFVSKDFISYVYRLPKEIKISSQESKIPLRRIAEKTGLKSSLSRKKIGFSASLKREENSQEHYRNFREVVLGSIA
ncbi:asparagine synthase (glutamine-hydrolyzing) [Chromohalobacter israelensis]|uniref:asparagine synthase (glutamine-hydrolyzing) n=1 Tax=Chromohalobacter israelensis TaxID=141390 RepID=UPI003D7981BE